MDKLKDFIQANREAFNDDALPEGHFERFERKLPGRQKKRTLLYSICIFAAASIALLLLFQFPIPLNPDKDPDASCVCENQEEFEELRFYYNMQMNDMITRMEALYAKDKAPGGEDLLKETRKVLADNYMFEEAILPTLPCSNKGLYAMNQHYTNSLESLNIMFKQMENITDEY